MSTIFTTQHMIDRGVLRCMSNFLLRKNIEEIRTNIEKVVCKTTKHIISRNSKKFDAVEKIQLEVCRIIANIITENRKNIQAVIDAKLIGHLVELIRTGDTEPDVKYVAALAISHAITDGTDEQIKYAPGDGGGLRKAYVSFAQVGLFIYSHCRSRRIGKTTGVCRTLKIYCTDKFGECDFAKFEKTVWFHRLPK
ncbi:hypothetical protein K7X08_033625 [Anisodus acutangulus]|uniref:Uncharacterized protein n=1 Tax=Anisodus acutangulus TaxID=402998 RepID=A0A9Q1RCS1_9SOLA|nr:hypothetical protein K7X08_033625 [Anisodus acutangulus]